MNSSVTYVSGLSVTDLPDRSDISLNPPLTAHNGGAHAQERLDERDNVVAVHAEITGH
jgi:hypothetical protein